MTNYRTFITELDCAMKMDSNMGYWATTFCTTIIVTQLVYSVILNF